MKDTTYNGWENYETWAVALWIDNEEHLHNTARSIAAEEYKKAVDTIHGPDGINIRDVAAERNTAEAIEEWITDSAPDLGATLFADLLTSALSEVNWREVAKHYAEDLEGTR